MVLGAILTVALAAAPFDVTTAFGLVHARAGLPALVEKGGHFSLDGRVETSVTVDTKNGFLSWTEGDARVEFAVFRTSKKTFVAVRSSVEGKPGGTEPQRVRFEAWTVDPLSKDVTDAPKVVASVPFLEAFVAEADVPVLPNLSDEELTPWLSRVVKLPREGLAVEVTWSAGALERECASTKRAPELLCRNLAVLKYGARRATWDRASATFKLVKKHG